MQNLWTSMVSNLGMLMNRARKYITNILALILFFACCILGLGLFAQVVAHSVAILLMLIALYALYLCIQYLWTHHVRNLLKPLALKARVQDQLVVHETN